MKNIILKTFIYDCVTLSFFKVVLYKNRYLIEIFVLGKKKNIVIFHLKKN